jgi:hypothetical protein
MSDNLTYDFGNMNSNILRTNSVLNRVLSSEDLSEEDASYLKGAAALITRQLMDYRQIAVYDLERIAFDELPNASEIAAADMAIFYGDLYAEYPSTKESVALNEEQLKKFRTIKQIVEIWHEEVEVHSAIVNPSKTVEETAELFLDGEYPDIYEEGNITEEHWVDHLVNLSNRTEAHLKEYFIDTDHGLRKYLSES